MNALAIGPLAPDDGDAVTRVWRECEIHDDGDAMFTIEDYVGFSQRPSFDFAAHSRAVRDDGRIVALAATFGDDVCAFVLPAYRGRGLGAQLLSWSEGAVAATGRATAGQTLSDRNADAVALLRAHGYQPEYVSWLFAIDLDREPPPPVLGDGYALRDLRAGGTDARAAHAVIDRAFGEWPGREPEAFEDWAAEVVGRPGFEPEHVALVTHGDEAVGAMVMVADPHEGWVAQLAVAREHRRRGLAHALLRHAFTVTWRRGVTRCRLGTDSRTGARGLYESVGMQVTRSFTHYSRQL